ncbi:MAG: Uracil DNA glycosylase superfamily protein [candidate division TM6 bacterium GW2011_GWF2_38_10]|nr:MAG: Uracil DNA glycosylase superfamily protein [candidate division TM6 bacterium GW2011_GWF2_38_10]
MNAETHNMLNHKNTTKNQQAKLESLYKDYEQCSRCPLAQQGRKHIVFGQGNPQASLMFIGEAPGRDEDIHGIPFIGRAGQLLTKIIQAMNLTREQVYISNVVKCRPPNNRTPLPDERETCKKMLFAEIDIIQPKVICLLGATATQALLGNDMKISPTRGAFFTFRTILTMPTYHPAYLLRNPQAKKIVWEDMKKIMNVLGLSLPVKSGN